MSQIFKLFRDDYLQIIGNIHPCFFINVILHYTALKIEKSAITNQIAFLSDFGEFYLVQVYFSRVINMDKLG